MKMGGDAGVDADSNKMRREKKRKRHGGAGQNGRIRRPSEG